MDSLEDTHVPAALTVANGNFPPTPPMFPSSQNQGCSPSATAAWIAFISSQDPATSRATTLTIDLAHLPGFYSLPQSLSASVGGKFTAECKEP